MKKTNSRIDEMQELNMLHIERNAFWIVYFGLLIAFFAQILIYQEEGVMHVAGEVIVLVIACVYLVAACIRKGLWDRRIPATPKANLIVSFVCAAVFSIVMAIEKYMAYDSLGGAIAAGFVFFIITFIIAFAALSILTVLYKKRREKLENEEED